MKDIDDKDLVDVSGGGDRPAGANLQPDQDLTQDGGSGDEDDTGNAQGVVSGDGSQQNLV